jgi:hypothetical protein
MAAAVVQTKSATATTGTTKAVTLTSTGSGNLLWCGLEWNSNTVTCSAPDGTWTQYGSTVTFNTRSVAVFYKPNIAGGLTTTGNFTFSGSVASVAVAQEISGVPTSSPAGASAATNSSNSANIEQTGTITPTLGSNNIVCAVCCNDSGDQFGVTAPTNGFSKDVDVNNSTTLGLTALHLIGVSSPTSTASATLASAPEGVAGIAFEFGTATSFDPTLFPFTPPDSGSAIVAVQKSYANRNATIRQAQLASADAGPGFFLDDAPRSGAQPALPHSPASAVPTLAELQRALLADLVPNDPDRPPSREMSLLMETTPAGTCGSESLWWGWVRQNADPWTLAVRRAETKKECLKRLQPWAAAYPDAEILPLPLAMLPDGPRWSAYQPRYEGGPVAYLRIAEPIMPAFTRLPRSNSRELVQHILDRESAETLRVAVPCNGGSMQGTLFLCDAISRPTVRRVETFALDWCASAGAMLFLMGDRRYVTEDAVIALHGGPTLNNKLQQTLLSWATGWPLAMVSAWLEHPVTCFTAAMALRYGLATDLLPYRWEPGVIERTPEQHWIE